MGAGGGREGRGEQEEEEKEVEGVGSGGERMNESRTVCVSERVIKVWLFGPSAASPSPSA